MTIATQSLAGLSLAEKRRLLAHLLEHQSEQSAAAFPLSYGQRGLWFLHKMDPRSSAYNVCSASRIRSPLDLSALRRALHTLVDRHPALRATFEDHDGVLLQRVHAQSPLPLDVIEASSWSEEALRERLEDEAHRPFDLARGPLLRVHLFRRAPDDHIFLLGGHHIVGDFWSLVVVMAELQALYPAECDGRPAALPAPAKQYRDFVRWQAELLAGPEGERLWEYWERRLAGAPRVLDLPTDRPRPPAFSWGGGALLWTLGADLVRRLKALAASVGTTLYTVLLAAFQVQLGRYTGREDFLVGCPFAGRSRPEFQDVVGYFINMLPLRADLSGDPPFAALLRRVGATVLDALEHQDYPFALLVERLSVERDPSRAPLVQVSFTLELAQQLLAHGESIRMLALFDTIPETADDPNWADKPGGEYGVDLSLEELSRLGPDEQLPYLWQHALRLGLIESSVPVPFAHQVLDDLTRIFHHHMTLVDHFVIRRYSGRITLFRPSDAPVAVPTPHDRGWGRLAAEVEVHFVPGQHHSMVGEPHVRELARTLDACLRQADEKEAAPRRVV
jgi:hypothetical protein